MKQRETFPLECYSLLSDTYLAQRMEVNGQFLNALDPDRLLYNFRKNAGLPTKGAVPYGTWESDTHQFRGHFTGHYLSACAKSSITLQKLFPSLAGTLGAHADYVVSAMEECQNALSKKEEIPGYLAAVPSQMLDDLESLTFTGVHTVVYYNLHKTMVGLLDAYRYRKNNKALILLERLTAYLNQRLKRLPKDRIWAMLTTLWNDSDTLFHMEFGGMHEVLLRAFQLTQNPLFADTAAFFDRPWFRQLLQEPQDLFGWYSLHTNTEIPCVHGLAEYADVYQDATAQKQVETFLQWMKEGHQFPSGGASGRSAYPEPADYGGELFEFPGMFFKHSSFNCNESCCNHNLNRLAVNYLQWHRDTTMGDMFENRFVNGILAHQHPETGAFVYHLNLHQGAKKNHSLDGFFCCNGSGAENFSHLQHGSCYFAENELLLVNYLPGQVAWQEKGIVLTTETEYPYQPSIRISLSLDKPQFFSLSFRIPAWSDKTSLLVNGERQSVSAGTFATITRKWHDCDHILLTLPFSYRFEAMPDRRNYLALFYGPHLMVGVNAPYAVFPGTGDQLLLELTKNHHMLESFFSSSTDCVSVRPISLVQEESYNGYTIVAQGESFRTVDAINFSNDRKRISGDCTIIESALYAGATETLTFHFQDFSSNAPLYLALTYKEKGTFYPNHRDFHTTHSMQIKDMAGTVFAVQSLQEDYTAPLTTIYYPLPTFTGGDIQLSGYRYHGKEYPIPTLFQDAKLGYFDSTQP